MINNHLYKMFSVSVVALGLSCTVNAAGYITRADNLDNLPNDLAQVPVAVEFENSAVLTRSLSDSLKDAGFNIVLDQKAARYVIHAFGYYSTKNKTGQRGVVDLGMLAEQLAGNSDEAHVNVTHSADVGVANAAGRLLGSSGAGVVASFVTAVASNTFLEGNTGETKERIYLQRRFLAKEGLYAGQVRLTVTGNNVDAPASVFTVKPSNTSEPSDAQAIIGGLLSLISSSLK